MSNRIAFETTIVDEPPSRLDLDNLIAGSRRRLRYRRATATAAVVLGLAGAVAIPVLVAADLGPTSGPGTVAGHLSTEERLAEAWREAVLAHVPGVQLPGPFVVMPINLAHDPLIEAAYAAQQSITVGALSGVLGISVVRDSRFGGRLPVIPCLAEALPAYSCQESTGPGGEPMAIEVVSGALAPGEPVVRWNQVYAMRGDDTIASVYVSAWDGDIPHVTMAQLTAIALDPRVDI
jgi:hypothetical protein